MKALNTPQNPRLSPPCRGQRYPPALPLCRHRRPAGAPARVSANLLRLAEDHAGAGRALPRHPPDLRGCGASGRPDHGYDKHTVAEDVHQLARQLDLGPVNLVGHDVGMMVAYAYAYAASFRSDVKRLALMEAALPALGREELYDAARFPRMYHLPLFEAPNALAEQLIAGRERMFVEHFMLQQAYDTTGPGEDALRKYARWLSAPGALHAGISYFRSHWTDAKHNREHAKTKLAMPVLTIAGSASAGADIGPHVRQVAGQLKSVMIEDCGHYVAEEQPGRVTGELLRFFTEDLGS